MEQQATDKLVPVFLPERPEAPGIGKARSRIGFDFYRQETATGLENEINLEVGGGAPKQDLETGNLTVAPHQEVSQDQIFKMGSGSSAGTAQPKGESRIAPIELRALDQPFGPAERIGFNAHQLEGSFEQIKGIMYESAECVACTPFIFY